MKVILVPKFHANYEVPIIGKPSWRIYAGQNENPVAILPGGTASDRVRYVVEKLTAERAKGMRAVGFAPAGSAEDTVWCEAWVPDPEAQARLVWVEVQNGEVTGISGAPVADITPGSPQSRVLREHAGRKGTAAFFGDTPEGQRTAAARAAAGFAPPVGS